MSGTVKAAEVVRRRKEWRGGLRQMKFLQSRKIGSRGMRGWQGRFRRSREGEEKEEDWRGRKTYPQRRAALPG